MPTPPVSPHAKVVRVHRIHSPGRPIQPNDSDSTRGVADCKAELSRLRRQLEPECGGAVSPSVLRQGTIARRVLQSVAVHVPTPVALRIGAERADPSALRGLLADLTELRARLPRIDAPRAFQQHYASALERVDGDLAVSQHLLIQAMLPAESESESESGAIASSLKPAESDEPLPNDFRQLRKLAAEAWASRAQSLRGDQWVDTGDCTRLQAAFELFAARWMARVCDTSPDSPQREDRARRSPARHSKALPFDGAALRQEARLMAKDLGGMDMDALAQAILAHRWLDLCRAQAAVGRHERLAHLLAGLVSGSHDDRSNPPKLVSAVLNALVESAPRLSVSTRVLATVLQSLGGVSAQPAHVAPITATLERLQRVTHARGSGPGQAAYSGSPT